MQSSADQPVICKGAFLSPETLSHHLDAGTFRNFIACASYDERAKIQFP